MRIHPIYPSFVLLLALPIVSVSQEPAAPSAPPAAAPAPEEPKKPEKTPEQLEAEKKAVDFLNSCMAKLREIKFVSAEMTETIYVADRKIESSGTFLRGPENRGRLELHVNIGDAVGTRLQVSNGKVGYQYRKLLEQEDLRSVDLSQVVPLLETKEIPANVRRELISQLPLLEPGQMLQGYLDEVVFTGMETREFGENPKRSVTVLEGHWNEKVVDSIAGKPTQGDLSALGGNIPQYVRLFLDDESGWPLRVELFRRNEKAEFKPVFVLEFTKLVVGEAIPEEQFTYAPPKGVEVVDITAQLVGSLQALPEKAGAAGANNAAAGAVSAPIDTAPKEVKN
jgi:outer membrane lipoprotein-sorting protein